ncbi:MAG: hypothetical protein GY930_17935 [bacterium]|nr:hypothetical protein [bacterium]
MHERLGYVVIGTIAALLGSSCLLLYRAPAYRTHALWLAGGVAMNASAVAQEWLEWSREWTGWAIGVRAAVEEGSELVASFLYIDGSHASELHARTDSCRRKAAGRILLDGV